MIPCPPLHPAGRCRVIGLLALVVLLSLGCGDANEPTSPLNSRARTARARGDAIELAAVSAGHGHTCGLASDGKAFCWGLNRAGELGIGTDDGPEQCRSGDDIEGVVFSCSAEPVPVLGGLFNSLSAGGGRFIGFTCGVGGDAKGYCWGFNRSGQLGIGETGGSRNLPVPVDPPPDSDTRLDFKSVSAGDNHACGLTTNDVVYCWGDNSAGQLGIGNRDGPEQCGPGHPCSGKPVKVLGGLFNSVSAGGDGGLLGFTCGVGGDSKAYCWGSNFHGMLGTGERDRGRAFLPVPVAPPAGSDTPLDFKSLSAGRFHACGVAIDGTAYCWGANWFGQLGNGQTDDISYVPVRVEGGPTFMSVDAGGLFTCGVTISRSTVCWGSNSSGQLGLWHTGGHRSQPVPVVHGDFESVSAGDSHACGITATLEVFCWGDNQFGQLANGTTFPWRDIRLHVIPLADDDGDHAFSVTAQEFADLVARASL